jgi:hypothetical protein
MSSARDIDALKKKKKKEIGIVPVIDPCIVSFKLPPPYAPML